MLLIKDTMVSLDLIERFFVCDLDSCLGQCCIDGDAGAPLLEEEREEIERHMDEILPLLNPSAQSIIKECGASYIDEEGGSCHSDCGGEGLCVHYVCRGREVPLCP